MQEVVARRISAVGEMIGSTTVNPFSFRVVVIAILS